jgi:hypothetical protein
VAQQHAAGALVVMVDKRLDPGLRACETCDDTFEVFWWTLKQSPAGQQRSSRGAPAGPRAPQQQQP